MQDAGYAGSQPGLLAAWMHDHWQPSFLLLTLISFGFFSISEKRLQILSWIKHYSGNTISTRIQSLSIILKHRLPLFKTTSSGECLCMIKRKCKRGLRWLPSLLYITKYLLLFKLILKQYVSSVLTVYKDTGFHRHISKVFFMSS